MKKAVIVLPTYNESRNVAVLINQIFEVAKTLPNWELHIAVVDSDSPDGTAQIVDGLIKQHKNLHLIRTKKEGLGKAYVEGFKTVIDKLNPFVIFEMDADLSHPPNEIPKFLEKIAQGADFVIGSRYIKGGSIPKDWGLHRKIFSITANWFIRIGFMKMRITEWTNGFRAIKVWIIKSSIPHISNYSGYVFQVALLDNAVKMGARIEEVPIHFVDRKEGVSKINSFQYIAQTFLYVLSNSSFIKFVIVGLTGFVVDFGISYFFIDIMRSAVWIGTLISTELAIICNFIFNNYWSFSHKRIDGSSKSLIAQFAKFNLISSGSILIQTVGVALLAGWFGREYWALYKVIIITFIIIPYSYILYNKFVWKSK